MKLERLTPMLYTKHLSETVKFYIDKLGFQCEELDEAAGWALVQKNDIQLMFSLPNVHLPFEKPHFTGSFYFKIQNAEQLWKELKEEVNIGYPLEVFEYGMKEFGIYDNNGYLLQFGEEVGS